MVYVCAHCGKKVKQLDNYVRCSYCGYKVLVKARPSVPREVSTD
jgi:DNA-directed RNA polymerase subunit RPC12/RpoP